MRQDYIDQLMALDMEIDLASHSFKKSSKHLKTLLKALPFVESEPRGFVVYTPFLT